VAPPSFPPGCLGQGGGTAPGGESTRLVLISNPADWGEVLKELRSHLTTFPVLGLDCEWVSEGGKANPVCLLQLATVKGLVLLIRLNTVGLLPICLKEILASFEVFKVGVAVTGDSSKLVADHGLDVGGCVDLRHLVLAYRGSNDGHPGKLGLEALAESFLGVSLDKDWKVRAGDWEAETLSERQLNYAANDALVAVNVLWRLIGKEFRRSWVSFLASLLWDEDRLKKEVAYALEQWVDLEFNNRDWKQRLKEEKSPSPQTIGLKRMQNSTRKTPLYHNCMLEAPDGQLLCTCDTKKAHWYISKGIGYQVSEDPLIVRLKFEPSGRPEGKAGEYYLTVKPNICVVCGVGEAYLRKNVVPHEYRKYFPAVMKDHQSHDVLLMCVRCHQVSNLHDSRLRQQLADECGAPITSTSCTKVWENSDMKRVRSAGRAIQANRKRQSIPLERLEELTAVLRTHFGMDDVTEEMVDEAASIDCLEVNGEYVPHSRAVVQHHMTTEGLSLIQLESRWRQHFIDTMKPRFLPDLWSVDHQAERLDVKAAEQRIDMVQYKLAREGGVVDLEEYRKEGHAQLGINPDNARL